MTTNVKDRLYLQVIINGQTLPDTQILIDYIHIAESCRQYLPVLTMSIQDSIKFLTSKSLLEDGALIQVIIGVANKKLDYTFRQFSVKENQNAGSMEYKITAYLNVPKYWSSSATESKRGSVSSVLQDISKDTDLSYEGVTTSENQLWPPHNKKYCEYARSISERGYLDESSCLQQVVTLDKKLRYLNVTDQFSKADAENFSNRPADSSTKVITDYRVKNSSGFFNAISGYKDKKIIQSLLAEDLVLDKTSVAKHSKHVSISSEVREGTDQGSISFSPIEIGNSSENYEQSLYQNRRLSNLYVEGIEFMTPRPIDSSVLDIVSLELSKPGAESVAEISGKYIVVSKVIYVKELNFYTKLEVFRHGSNKIVKSDLE